MKAVEAKEKTNMEKYKMVMENIHSVIKRGEKKFKMPDYSLECFFEDPEEVIEMLLNDGYDLTLHYTNDDFRAITISWEKSQEGRKGIKSCDRKIVEEKKPGILERIGILLSSLSYD